ncbi:MAG TPA: Crp/Fnr family transcriptional regulator [Tissierellales bacterium]|nr:Crp/Fnr family transcriptional regulator [Tissierellales bacterium]
MTKKLKKKIKKLNLFYSVQTEYINYLAQKSFIEKFKEGDILFFEQDEMDYIYIVLKGKVTLFKLSEIGQKRIIFLLDKGDIVNEVIFDDLPSSISCEAFEDSEVLKIDKDALLYIMSKDFNLTKKIINSISKKNRRLYRQLKNIIPIRMDKKLAAKLWKLSRDYGVDIEEGVLIDLNLSVTYLADMLGSTRETVSRAINDFVRCGLIQYKNNKIVVKNRDELSIYFRGV